MKIKNYLYVATLAVALTACGGGGGMPNFGNNEFPVETIGSNSASLQSTYPATIRGIQDVEVRPKVSGFITNVYVHEGQAVSAGQLLFTIDSETYRAAVRQAQAGVNTATAQLNTARLTYENNKKLFDKKVIGQYELSTAQNTFEVFFSMAESDILDMTQAAGNVAAALKDLPAVKLQLADGTIYNHPGKVVKMSGVINASTGAYSLIAHFDNPEKLLKSGGSGTIIIPRTSQHAIVIPQEATTSVQDKLFVYKVGADNKVKYTEIKVNPQNDGNTYIVTDGLAVGDRIVLKGLTKLSDNMQIKPISLAQYNKSIDDAAKLGEKQSSAGDFVKTMQGK